MWYAEKTKLLLLFILIDLSEQQDGYFTNTVKENQIIA